MSNTMHTRIARAAAIGLLLAVGAGGAHAWSQPAPAAAPVVAPVQPALPYSNVKLADDLWMVSGGTGANVTVMTTDEGLVLIDGKHTDQYAGLIRYIRETISTKPILYVVTTHYHNDHSGTNGAFRKDGIDVISSVRGRENILNGVQPGAKDMVPANITFRGELRLTFGTREVRLRAYPSAHTGTDVVAFFPQQKVICVGDLSLILPPTMKVSLPPGPIDYNGGGGIGPWIEVLQQLIDMDGYDRVVPGHGVLGSRADLVAYRDKLTGVRDRVRAFLLDGTRTEADLRAYLTGTEKWSELFVARAAHGLYWDLRP